VGRSLFILIRNNSEWSRPRQEASSVGIFLTGLFFAYLVYGLGSALGGFTGGLTLTVVGGSHGRWGYAWQSAVCYALLYSGFIFSTILAISLLSFYQVDQESPVWFSVQLIVLGVIFGALFGSLMGLLTVGWRRRAWIARIALASAIGFGLGGAALGSGMWLFLTNAFQGDLYTGQYLYLILGVYTFNFCGGGALGLVYSHLATKPADHTVKTHSRALVWGSYVTIGGILVILIFVLRPVLAMVGTALTPRSANHDKVLESNTAGTHWFDPVLIASLPGSESPSAQTAVGVADDRVALAWTQPSVNGSELIYLPGSWQEESQVTTWASPITAFNGDMPATDPQIVLNNGTAHLVWRAGDDIYYNRCTPSVCDKPVFLFDLADFSCVVRDDAEFAAKGAPALAISNDGILMAVWGTADGRLLYRSWPAATFSDVRSAGCVPAGNDNVTEHRLASRADGQFTLIYNRVRENAAGEIHTMEFDEGSWQMPSLHLATGESPEILIDRDGQLHYAWCRANGGIDYQTAGTAEHVSDLPCLSRPSLTADSNGRIHLVWFANEAINASGSTVTYDAVYESIRTMNGWTTPAIVVSPGTATQPAAESTSTGILHMVWPAAKSDATVIQYAAQIQYDCPEPPQRLSQIMLEVAQQTRFRPPETIVPYCNNQFDRTIYTPNPNPAFSDQSPSPNGGFDQLAEMITTAEYEVLFTTMDYDKAQNQDSPGAVLAAAVADLYQSLSNNPEKYPRGLTVRILLGNPPRFSAPNADLWKILQDLHDAGVPEMVNESIGWRLEVANFEGAWPNSHVKMVVVDGKTVVAVGFNMQYKHFPPEHPSGLGDGSVDTAVQVTGPVAQDARRAFDELWQGATLRHCANFFPLNGQWRRTCQDSLARADHAPEVMRYYLPRGNATAFSMLRTDTHNEADDQITAALAAAEKSIDIMHVQFSLALACNLEYLFEVCSTTQAPVYITSILDAVQSKDVQVRLLIDLEPIKGIESLLAVRGLQRLVDKHGMGDQVEIRAFPGPMHAKNTLIDDELLIVGSQNFHWIAFGQGQGLAEYNLGVSDPEAIEDFKQRFEYYWNLEDSGTGLSH